ncbi:uncharacterized 2Fe-2S/4Fe-4S cluster protein (DUF4445 family) [Alkalibaculum bacchi]|uniref:Uncharacterized 2Fe-2S/4Fe-4S cluster protein (DUF4445 family) n=1 Tax=Alkalibaculum bacchi TaxID=645887 RepID=A0A366IF83_9FIRM|nr:corrinoid activation/regeneration protein AcsV [Alkalibaculum bacchi]RBP68951.1 uncharacterized 2Fe-2S/4Fe-4S cluster protein (DUF4445 family) [Alkalibaculum bacchi]
MEIELRLPEEVKVFEANENDILINVIRNVGVHIDAPCNGSGTCGKCKVKLIEGKVGTIANGHRLTDEQSQQGFILACQSIVTSPIIVEVPKESILEVTHIRVEKRTHKDLEKYYNLREEFSREHDSMKNLSILNVQLDEPNLDDNISDVTRIKKFVAKELNNDHVQIGVFLLKKIPHVLRESAFNVSIIYTEEKGIIRIIDIRPQGDTQIYGVAVDIGTTSVSACLVDLNDDTILGEVSCANAQSKYGADVINRIVYSTKKNGLKNLKEAIVEESINPLINELCNNHKVKKEDILIFAASANTTMAHLLLGIHSDDLRKEPYIPAFTSTEDVDIRVDDIGLSLNKDALILISPSVASYVGGDISAGVIAAGMRESDENSILIDLGTNGEIVFGNRDFLMTCACSAGPAFEGGEISCGMRAANGAIEAVHIDPNTFVAELDIIGSCAPYGLCGSGIIDLISELKRVELIDPRGRFIKDKNTDRIHFDEYGIGRYIVARKKDYDLSGDIYITEVDIDNFIRAKAAVYSATYVLLSSLGLDFDMVSEIKVAGGIGSHINIDSAINIGLFPDIDKDKYAFIGNSSLTGSYMSLINKKAKEYIDDTANNMTYIELSVYPGYMDEFISASFIPHTDLVRFPTHNK